ncbi:hypothetical protein Pfo_015311 [Paulownia fortunei]|nr:hypothetical protein Pfo_015311 [Paulownia fortunei]
MPDIRRVVRENCDHDFTISEESQWDVLKEIFGEEDVHPSIQGEGNFERKNVANTGEINNPIVILDSNLSSGPQEVVNAIQFDGRKLHHRVALFHRTEQQLVRYFEVVDENVANHGDADDRFSFVSDVDLWGDMVQRIQCPTLANLTTISESSTAHSFETMKQRFFRINGFLYYETGFYVFDMNNAAKVDLDNKVGHNVNTLVIIQDDSDLEDDNDTSDKDDEEETYNNDDGAGHVDRAAEEQGPLGNSWTDDEAQSGVEDN